MKRNFLITVGDDPQFLYGARFAASFFRNKSGIRLNLLYLAPRFDSMDAREDMRLHEIDLKLSAMYARKGQKALQECIDILRSEGFSKGQISTKLIHRVHGTVKDIVEYARLTDYEAVVLGRRGYSIFEKAFGASVTEEIFDLHIDFPIWICRRPGSDLKNVLLCADGSDASLRAAEHVGSVLEEQEHQQVTLCYICTDKSANPEAVLDEVHQRVVDRIPDRRIERLVVRARSAAEAIIKEAVSGSFAAVAIGRCGVSAKAPLQSYMGSTCIQLLKDLEGAALWVKW
jgi:nucleotide-binding universal stress UspA family protein